MSGPIQTKPQGLLSLLELKNQGISPPKFVDDLQPTIDLTYMYAVGKLRFGANTNNLINGNVGFYNINLTVPNDETWLVYMHSIDIRISGALPVGSIVRGKAAMKSNLGPTIFTGQQGCEIVMGAAVAGQYAAMASWGAPYLAPPGSEIGAFMELIQTPVGSATVLTQCLYAPLRT